MSNKRKIDELEKLPPALKARAKVLDHRTQEKEILDLSARVREIYAEAAIKLAELLESTRYAQGPAPGPFAPGATAGSFAPEQYDIGKVNVAFDQLLASKDVFCSAFMLKDPGL